VAPTAPTAAAPGGPATASATSATGAAGLATQELAGMDTGAVARFVDGVGAQLPGAGFGWASLAQFLRGGGVLRHPGQLLPALGAVFVGELRSSLRLLGELLVLVVLAAVLRQLQAAWDNDTVGRIADAVVFLALGTICLASFAIAVGLARTAIADLSSFMLAILPAMVGLLMGSGAAASAGLLQPAMVGAIETVGVAVRAVVFPLALLAAVLDLVGAFAPSFRLSGLSGLMRHVSVGFMGLLLTGFLGVVGVLGAAGGIADGVALRAGKYAVKTFVPVVGSMLSDAAELVLTSGLLLRSGLGLLGLVTVALLVAVPVLKMLALLLVFRLAAALAGPVGGEGITPVLGGVGGAVALLTTAVALVGLLCFLSLAVLVGAGGAAWSGA
jgi:stage III sporulation protein AE